ncbi:MAG TPA: TonB-dependent receptor [Muribaculum sp.]|jgi:outer membrane receptor for ferrienterochelin and colicins|uniref:TonB-dependent receptor n=1 Tax=Heminiphilus faecis TaxID=2601703 RepID=A0ABV4CXM0_9BACT|nr:TonB-dependent receptor [Heminiphilus faecis]RLT77940.1 TonB-dependent receptor [bacterium J10(2018)]HRF69554.1 TonB-dependent receptor [Muribaculum sp.]
MFKKLFVAACAVAQGCLGMIAATSGAAVTDANISGHVVDAETGEHMPFYYVRILDTKLATLTDASGHYVFRDLAPGDYTLEAVFTGYKTVTLDVRVVKDRTVEANFSVVPDAFMLDQVVVTSSKSEVRRRESPALVNVITGKLFETVGACSLADGLNFQPGVRVENDCQNCGFTQVRINGLDGHYSQILMNSRPVFSALTGVYGLEQIPANMIERVEVMRGGGSALFGSSAIGGTINIITKDPMTNSARVAHTLSSIGLSGALDNNTTLNASVVTDNNKAGIFIYGQSRYRDGYDDNSDGFTEIAQLKTRTVGARAFVRPSDISRLSLEYHNTSEYRRGGDNLDQPPHMAMIAEQADHDIHAVEATFDIWPANRRDHVSVFGAMQNTRRQSYYGSDMDPDAYGRTSDIVVTSGAQWTHPFDRFIFMPSELVAGVEYSFNRLHDVTLGYDHDILQKVHIYSGYLQNEWRNSRWGFLVGARVDKHSLISDPVISPRVNIRYNPDDNLNFRLSYSTGFRSPQAYDEDFHVAIVGGERVVTVLAAGLKEESSRSVSASADLYHRFGNVQTNLLVEGFYTDLRDVFALRQLEEPDAAGNAVLERYNGSGARVAGVNVEAKAFFSSRFDLQCGLTWQRSRYKHPEVWSDNPDVPGEKRMFRTPDLYGYLTANVEIVRQLKATLSATYTGPMTVQHLAGSGTLVDVAVRTPDFFDASLKLTYTFKILNRVTFDVSAGVSNIFNSYQDDFDIGPTRDSGYIYGPALPRCINAGISVSL